MQTKVTGKTEKGLFADGVTGFIVYDRGYKGPRDFNKGDEVEIEYTVNGNWKNLTSLTVLNAAPAQAVPATNGATSTGSYGKNDPTVRTEIARGTAVKAVFSSPSLANAYRDLDSSNVAQELKDLVLEVTNYILTGNFKAKVLEETNGK